MTGDDSSPPTVERLPPDPRIAAALEREPTPWGSEADRRAARAAGNVLQWGCAMPWLTGHRVHPLPTSSAPPPGKRGKQ